MTDYLVRRKHPAAKWSPDPGALRSRPSDEAVAAARAYETRLKSLEIGNLRNEYDALRIEDSEAAHRKAKADEAGRSWNRPYAQTDYDFWSKAASWTLDEATALSLGRDPHHVSWKRLEGCTQISAFALKYQRQRDLILRAKGMSQLFEPAMPSFFLGWARRTGIELDPKLVEAVEARGVQVADWKTHYDEMRETALKNKAIAEGEQARAAMLEEQLEQQKQTYKELLDKAFATIDIHREREATALERAEGLEIALTELMAAVEAEKPLSTRERQKLLQILLGMAIACYGHDPRATRTTTASAILTDLDTVGISVSDDTIRKYLRDSAEFAPPPKAE